MDDGVEDGTEKMSESNCDTAPELTHRRIADNDAIVEGLFVLLLGLLLLLLFDMALSAARPPKPKCTLGLDDPPTPTLSPDRYF